VTDLSLDAEVTPQGAADDGDAPPAEPEAPSPAHRGSDVVPASRANRRRGEVALGARDVSIAGRGEGSRGGRRIIGSNNQSRRIHAYDFYRQETVDRARLRVLDPILETLCHRLSGATAGVTRLGVKIAIGELDQITWEEFATSQPDPTFVSTAIVAPLDGRLLIHMPVGVVLRVLDHHLGGDGASAIEREQLTDIERALVRPMFEDWWAAFKGAFANSMALHVAHVQQAASMLLLPVGRPGETCLIIPMTVEVNEQAIGECQLCIPISALHPLLDQIEAQQNNPTARVDSEETQRRLRVVPIEVKASYPAFTLTTTELLNLRVGDVVTVREGEPEQNVLVELVTGDVIVGTGSLVEIGGKLACTVATKREELS
jgi:flagellar motor switch protein FliM